MLRHRVITVLTFNQGVLFRTKLFQPDYRYTLNFVDSWSVDEIVVLDITRPGSDGRAAFESVVGDFAKKCFVPLAAGGFVRGLDDVERLLRLGADKVVVNSAAVERPELLSEIAARYGAQCVVLSMDVKKHPDGRYEVFSHQGSRPTGLDPVDWARRGVGLGAGEVLLTAMDRDGALQGYDLELCRRVADAVPVPVDVLGGCGTWQHMVDGVRKGGASGVCTQNIYHFTETSIKSAKRVLHGAGIPVRV